VTTSPERDEVLAALRRAGLRADDAQVDALLRSQPRRASEREALREWLARDDEPAGPADALGAFARPDDERRQ